MQVAIIKEFIVEEFTPMAWERVQLQLLSKVDDSMFENNAEVPVSMVMEINNVLEGLYGMGLPDEIKETV